MARPTSKLVRVNDKGYPVGQDHHRSKLTDHDVDLILELVAEGLSYREIARKFDIAYSTVGWISRGQKRSQLITRTVRRPIRYDEPEADPAAWHEFDEAST